MLRTGFDDAAHHAATLHAAQRGIGASTALARHRLPPPRPDLIDLGGGLHAPWSVTDGGQVLVHLPGGITAPIDTLVALGWRVRPPAGGVMQAAADRAAAAAAAAASSARGAAAHE